MVFKVSYRYFKIKKITKFIMMMVSSAGPKKKGFTASLAALLTAGIAAAAAAVVTGILFNSFKEAERTILLAPT